jgi:hypothetical protein
MIFKILNIIITINKIQKEYGIKILIKEIYKNQEL